MAKKKESIDGLEKFNRVSPGANVILVILFVLLALVCVIPLIFIIIISISSEQSIARNGFSFIPEKFSLDAYEYLWSNRNMVFDALRVSVIVTVVGTILGLFLVTSMGYVLSRKEYKLQGFFTWVVFIPMIFNGGLISTYFVNSSVLKLSNTHWALILPLLVQSFYVIICKTYFRTSLPDSIVESAQIDGASQIGIFFRIVLPISLPVLATIALFLTFNYWNDWYQALLYITEPTLKPLQALLSSIERNVEYMLQNAATLGVSRNAMLSKLPKQSFRMAIAVVIILPISFAYPFFQRYFISGLTVGAVKG